MILKWPFHGAGSIKFLGQRGQLKALGLNRYIYSKHKSQTAKLKCVFYSTPSHCISLPPAEKKKKVKVDNHEAANITKFRSSVSVYS